MNVEHVVEELLERRRVIVTAGAGGTGKTTIAAALAILAAREGRRAVVVTVDPARRLRDALGLEELHHTPRELPLDGVERSPSIPGRESIGPGRLSAMMLEPQPAWDRLIRAHARHPQRLLENHFYLRFRDQLAGAEAYAAIDTLCVLAESADYDTIVIDTPPLRHALELFRAPAKVLRLFEDQALQRALAVYRKITSQGGGSAARMSWWMVRRLEAAVGASALADAADFLTAFTEMADVFQSRARSMQRLLTGDALACVLVSTPDGRALSEARNFLIDAASIGVKTELLALNRSARAVIGAAPEMERDGGEALERELSEAFGAPLARSICECYGRYRARAELEDRRLAAMIPRELPRVRLRELERDVHDLAGLHALGAELLAA